MTPQTLAQWQAQLDSIAWLKRCMPLTWQKTVFEFEVGRRAGTAGAR